jgi:hypothetical protein
MTIKHVLIGAGVLGAGVALYFLVNRKSTLSNTGPSYSPPAGTPGPASTAGQVYSSQPGLTVRSSPRINTGFLGMFTNQVVAVTNAGTWIGTYAGSTLPDMDKTIDTATGQIYKWYQIRLAPAYQQFGDGTSPYYVRGDYAIIK